MAISNRDVEHLQGKYKKGKGKGRKTQRKKIGFWVPSPFFQNTVIFLFFSHPFPRLSHKLDVKHCYIQSGQSSLVLNARFGRVICQKVIRTRLIATSSLKNAVKMLVKLENGSSSMVHPLLRILDPPLNPPYKGHHGERGKWQL